MLLARIDLRPGETACPAPAQAAASGGEVVGNRPTAGKGSPPGAPVPNNRTARAGKIGLGRQRSILFSAVLAHNVGGGPRVMLVIPGAAGRDLCDRPNEITRRDLLRVGGSAMLGVSL